MTRRAAPAAPTATARPGRSIGNAVMFAIIGFIVLSFVILGPGRASDIFFITPLINALVLLDIIVLGQFGLAIILFTLLVRMATLPFTVRQFQSMKAMQTMQPMMQEIQKKHKDPKRRQEEMMKLYREHNINPLGCAMPFLIQMVLFFALYRALVFVVGGSPESLVGLSQRLYPLSILHESIPLNQHFLWLDLGQSDNIVILPNLITPLSLLVAATTYVQQRMSVTPNATPQQQQQQQMMLWMFPFMLMFMTASFPSGVGIYWITTNFFSIFVSYYVYGRAFNWRQLLTLPSPAPTANPAPAAKRSAQPPSKQAAKPEENAPATTEPEAGTPAGRVRPAHGKRRGKRKNRR